MQARRVVAWLAAALAVLVIVSECLSVVRLQAENVKLRDQTKSLENRIADLMATQPTMVPVQLVDSRYPPVAASKMGWDYYKTAEADFDGDGVKERLVVITSALWDAKFDNWAWDDGHPWHVYVQEPDGTRTYVFSGWVQLGRLEVFVGDSTKADGGKPILILRTGGVDMGLYRVTYFGPARQSAVQLLSEPMSGVTGFTDSRLHD